MLIRDRDTYSRAKKIFFRVLICVMALCTGLYLRSLTAGRQMTYHKLSSEARKNNTVLMIRDIEKEKADQPQDLIANGIGDLLNEAVSSGSEFLSRLVDTVTQSDLGQQIFSEENLNSIEGISEYAEDLLSDLIRQASGNSN